MTMTNDNATREEGTAAIKVGLYAKVTMMIIIIIVCYCYDYYDDCNPDDDPMAQK